MPPSQQPPNVRQRRVARALRRWRNNAGQKLDETGKQLGWSDSKLSRLETAAVHAGPAEIIALATVLGVDEAERDRTVRLAVSATQSRDEWGTYGPGSLRGDLKDFIEDESEAVEVRTVEMVLVTGLLQTDRYSEELLRAWEPDLDQKVLDERRRLRRQRRARLDDQADPLRLHAIMLETALTLPIGGPLIMADQLDHLATCSEKANITIQVLPANLGAFPGFGTAYHLVYVEQDVAMAAYVDGLTDGAYIEEEDQVAAYTLNFERLRERALSPDESARRIAEIKRAWKLKE
ncbi:helix-turn-helix domain-containing protein [Labedaea rhizosphaerae]|uniref:Helix-turn-helix protein n=1 Tax=Labedaea rhizosphaerae TaxID=598644 RepID=A0A4R6SGG7_LABRH|nr:helix-turn-helix transcriptional regulator [Labedaea rhizosphaerae]TDQ00637.1 helix-turn-helix protein [Labedaea rhizosphaerae]